MKSLLCILLLFSVLFGQSLVGKRGLVAYDNRTEAVIVEDYEHFKVHAGSHFFVQDTFILGNGDSLALKFTTGNVFPHVVFSINSNNITEGSFFREITSDSVINTDTLLPVNSNFNSTVISGMSVFESRDTILKVRTLLPGIPFTFGASSGSTRFGGESRSRQELIFKPNKSYLLLIRSLGATNRITVNATWYE